MNNLTALLIGHVKHGNLKVVKATLILSLALLALPAYAEDWKTTDGKVYVDVKVIRVEDDAVTILDKDGGALIPLFKLPPELQQKFSYDPVKAKIAADARAKADAENAVLLQKEMAQADALKKKNEIQSAQQASAAKGSLAPQ